MDRRRLSEARNLAAALRQEPGQPGTPGSPPPPPPPKLHFAKIGSSAYHDVPDVYRHITDPNEKRRLALAEIDKAPLGWYHVRMVVVTGVGFFTDAYSIFAINLTTIMFGIVFWQHSNGGRIPHDADVGIKVATAIGTIIGQIGFGFLTDVVGRKKMYGVELMIIIFSTLVQAMISPSYAVSFTGVMVFWRVIMGLGVGGDYPMSVVITSEFANTRWRGSMVGAVFAQQGFGQFAAAIITLIVTVANKSTLIQATGLDHCNADCLKAVDTMWRIIIGFGGVPGWFAVYYRLTIPETPRYTFDVLRNVEKASADARWYRSGRYGEAKTDEVLQATTMRDMRQYNGTRKPTVLEALRYFACWRNGLILFGTAGSWMMLDVAFYGINLNSSQILSTMGFAQMETKNLYEMLYNMAVGQLVLICAGAIPGYWATVLTIDWLGRKTIQIGGFAILTLLFAVIGFHFDNLSKQSLIVLYVFCQFFFNFGPNATTFIYPGELFPTRVRGTGAGISAAAGKVGAVLAQVVFAPMAKRGATPENHDPWLNRLMQIFALFMLCGLLTSLLLPETKRKTLEELAGERDDKPVYELKFVCNFFRQDDGERARGWRNLRQYSFLPAFWRLRGKMRKRRRNDEEDESEQMSESEEGTYVDSSRPSPNVQANTVDMVFVV
ncbi:phosphate permease [Aulographum hederae CBS 113979]|uniref:Phosphate permease n=1 Tax=Aulographum hederae CBS 113979 TaxID=1176131 RepID=A0A6G1HBX9_9PEZI|nr:phosphate permease [Aulographum hederae CBS 113979]